MAFLLARTLSPSGPLFPGPPRRWAGSRPGPPAGTARPARVGRPLGRWAGESSGGCAGRPGGLRAMAGRRWRPRRPTLPAFPRGRADDHPACGGTRNSKLHVLKAYRFRLRLVGRCVRPARRSWSNCTGAVAMVEESGRGVWVGCWPVPRSVENHTFPEAGRPINAKCNRCGTPQALSRTVV
jgi:hypothetical protein